MCTRPCWGTPSEIQKIIDSGLGNRLYSDYWSRNSDHGDINMIQPALKGHESNNAPFWPRNDHGCTFWKNGLCELHDSGMKPIEGRLAHHSKDYEAEDKSLEMSVHEMVARTWDNEEGRQVYENWIKDHYIEREEIDDETDDGVHS